MERLTAEREQVIRAHIAGQAAAASHYAEQRWHETTPERELALYSCPTRDVLLLLAELDALRGELATMRNKALQEAEEAVRDYAAEHCGGGPADANYDPAGLAACDEAAERIRRLRG